MTGQTNQRTKNMVHYPSGDATAPNDLSTYIDTLRADVNTLQAVTPVTADSAFGTDNRLIRSDGTARKAQVSAVTVDDSGNASGIVNQTMTGYLDVAEISAPSSPAADTARVYAKDDSGTSKLYYKRSTGTEVELAAVASVGLVLLTSGTVTAAATLDLALGAYTAYRGIVVKLSSFIPVNDGVILRALFSPDNASTFLVTDYNLTSGALADNSGTEVFVQSGTGTAINISGAGASTGVGNGANEGWNGEFEILDWQSTALWPRALFRGYHISNGATPVGVLIRGGAAHEVAQAMTGLRFLFSAGNIASGNYAVYGLA